MPLSSTATNSLLALSDQSKVILDGLISESNLSALRFPVIFISDNEGVEGCIVAVRSVLANNSHTGLIVYIAAVDLIDEMKARPRKLFSVKSSD